MFIGNLLRLLALSYPFPLVPPNPLPSLTPSPQTLPAVITTYLLNLPQNPLALSHKGSGYSVSSWGSEGALRKVLGGKETAKPG